MAVWEFSKYEVMYIIVFMYGRMRMEEDGTARSFCAYNACLADSVKGPPRVRILANKRFTPPKCLRGAI